MSLPSQMTAHELNPCKAWGANLNCLDYSARISGAVLYDMRAGQVAHLNTAGELEPGAGTTCVMPLFMFQGKNDLDVNNEGNDEWTPTSPSGRVMCLVATGGYELETTEFIDTLEYAPNDRLYSPVGLTSGDEFISGMLTNATPGTIYASGMQTVVGIVSRGKFTNVHRVPVVAFWSCFLPGKA